MKRRRAAGFSLAELLVVMMITAALVGGVTLTAGRLGNEDALVLREAENLKAWLSERMMRAQARECDFTLSASRNGADNVDFVLREIEKGVYGPIERYQADGARLFPAGSGLVTAHRYRGEWNTLSPAVTVSVNSIPPANGRRMFVVVSALGFVSVRPNP